MLKDLRLGFIGSGKMAEAMIGGLLRRELVSPAHICAAGPREERARTLEKQYGITATTDNRSVAQSDLVTLAVKPQTMPAVFQELAGCIPEASLVVSIAAGVRLETICKGLACRRVVRAMPNTPGRINRGITVWTATADVTAQQRNQAKTLLSALGTEVFVAEEKYLDMATALSGTGPAYVFLFMEALIDAGVRLGLPRHLAKQLVFETVGGSVEYARAATDHLAQLRNDVTSPAGTSAEALHCLEGAGFRTALANAVQAAHARSLELGKS